MIETAATKDSVTGQACVGMSKRLMEETKIRVSQMKMRALSPTPLQTTKESDAKVSLNSINFLIRRITFLKLQK